MDNSSKQIGVKRGARSVLAVAVGFVDGLVLGVMALGLVFFIFVMPVLNEIEKLPSMVRGLMNFSCWMKDIGWVLMVALAAAVTAVGIVVWRRLPTAQRPA